MDISFLSESLIMILILQKFMNAMRPSIRYIAADRPKGIANVQFVVRKTLKCLNMMIE